MSTVSIVIVNWNAADVLTACLRSIGDQTGVEIAEAIVVDNASSDGSIALLEAARGETGFELVTIANADNRGFGAANNQGVRASSGERLVLLNPDTEFVGSDSLAALIDALDDDSIGIAGPHLLNTDGSTQGSCAAFPSITHSLAMATGLHKLLPAGLLKRVAPEEWAQDHSIDTDWLRGACLAFRREVYEGVGGFSEATFMYGEDLEIAFDVRKSGRRVRFCHESAVTHHDDHSANQRWNTPERMERVAQGALTFLARHYSPFRRALIRSVDACGYGVRWLIHGLRHDERAATYAALFRAYVRGLQ